MINLFAHQIVWDAVTAFLMKRRAEGAAENDALIEIVAALMDSTARLNILKGVDTETFARISAEHYDKTRELMREDLARVSN